MTKYLTTFSFIVAGCITILVSTSVAGADDQVLTIGDKAANLDIEHWISDGDGEFEHATELESGKVYVVEFWATWCGPCIASMPHLSELQEKYADKGVQIISVSDESLKKVKSFLKQTVRGEEEQTYAELTSNYCLTTDPDESVYKDYFQAAGRSGIPCAFIVGKTGLIEWIGHPMGMDEALEQVVDDQWDRKAFYEEYEAEQQQGRVRMKLNKAMQKISQLIEDGETEKALEHIDALIENKDYESMKEALVASRTQFVIMFMDDEQALAALNEFAAANKNDPDALNQISWLIWEKNENDGKVAEKLLNAAVATIETAVELQPEDSSTLDTFAHLIYLQGDLDRAIEIQEKAVKNAGRMKPQVAPFLKQLKSEKEEAGGDDKDDKTEASESDAKKEKSEKASEEK